MLFYFTFMEVYRTPLCSPLFICSFFSFFFTCLSSFPPLFTLPLSAPKKIQGLSCQLCRSHWILTILSAILKESFSLIWCWGVPQRSLFALRVSPRRLHVIVSYSLRRADTSVIDLTGVRLSNLHMWGLALTLFNSAMAMLYWLQLVPVQLRLPFEILF